MPGERSVDDQRKRSVFERLLGLFAQVRAGEATTAVLMFFNIFLILFAYYLLKTVREGLMIGGVRLGAVGGDEAKLYFNAIMAFLLLGIVPLYGGLASRMSRVRLLRGSIAFIIGSLVVFFLWGRASGVGTAIGIAFFVWLGVVNWFLVAQFWSYANDIYNEEQGKRLFALIAIGQSLGAVLGPKIAGWAGGHTFGLMAGAAVLFVGCIVLYTAVDRREERTADDERKAAAMAPLSKEGGFALVFKTKYLYLIALSILLTNVVNSTGEYLLSNAAKRRATAEVPASSAVGLSGGSERPGQVTPVIDEDSLTDEQRQVLDNARGVVINKFYGDFYFIVNLIGVLVQMFLVSRIFKYLGIRVALFFLPVIAFGGYVAIGLIGGLFVIRAAKTIENAIDYSLQNTVKQALYLPTSREVKYKAKAVIDVFFVRFGDAISALLVGIGLHAFALGTHHIAYINAALALIWILVCIGIAREHRRLSHEEPPPRARAIK